MTSDLFGVDVRQKSGIRVVALSGELDLATAEGLVETLTDTHGSTVVVDLAQLSFVDSSGISAFVLARRQIEANSSTMVLTRPQERVARTFEIVGLGDWVAPWSSDWD